ncbi:MAG: double zinc ribbon domain-containing protein [Actinomycetota bacterium]
MGKLLDLVLPPRCASCGRDGWPLCPACTAEVAVITPPLCRRCGRPVEEPLSACADCPPRSIDAARAPFLYEGPVARAIRGMKFSGWHALRRHLAGAMAEVFDLEADVVTWVPLSRRRRGRRGFDQSEVLARGVAPLLGLPAIRLLRRTRDTPAQARRSGRDRRSSLRGAFVAAGPSPPRVLLVDDVLTTGATASACAAVLRRAGARRVMVLVGARSIGGPVPARCRPGDRAGGHGLDGGPVGG